MADALREGKSSGKVKAKKSRGVPKDKRAMLKKSPEVDEHDSKETEGEQQAVADNSEQQSEAGKGPEAEQEKPQEDYKSKYFYLAAEMDNMRKRFARERESLLKFGNEKIVKSLMEVVDNLERTMAAMEGDQDQKVKKIVEGVTMIQEQFLSVLKQNGVEQISALGEIFDPNIHEAMAHQEAEDKPENEIIIEYQKGYSLNGRLLRPAKVVVVQNKK